MDHVLLRHDPGGNRMKVSAAYLCDQGKVRKKNQDNLYFHGKTLKLRHKKAASFLPWFTTSEKAVCFGVFDGMGGEQYGEDASWMAAKVLKEKMRKERAGRIADDILYEVCHVANDGIYRKTQALGAARMGTTAAIIYIQYDRIWYCNVGDSKIYRLRNDGLEQLSWDHTAWGENRKKKKPGLTQHLGMGGEETKLIPYVRDDRVKEGDQYLICSDGLSDMVLPEEIKEILLPTRSLQQCNARLLQTALEHGGNDNITLITIRMG